MKIHKYLRVRAISMEMIIISIQNNCCKIIISSCPPIFRQLMRLEHKYEIAKENERKYEIRYYIYEVIHVCIRGWNRLAPSQGPHFSQPSNPFQLKATFRVKGRYYPKSSQIFLDDMLPKRSSSLV